MTYIKWQDELEKYLYTLSPEEKEKVFSYFAEMYADKRDAGIPEEMIIEEFGAPYDAAKRILAENGDTAEEPLNDSSEQLITETPQNDNGNSERRSSYTWLFILFFVIFAVPLFVLLVAMAGVTVGLCVTPVAVIAGGFATVGGAIGGCASGGSAAIGAALAGLGLIIVGFGLILAPLFFGLVKLMWKALTKIFKALQKAFSWRG